MGNKTTKAIKNITDNKDAISVPNITNTIIDGANKNKNNTDKSITLHADRLSSHNKNSLYIIFDFS